MVGVWGGGRGCSCCLVWGVAWVVRCGDDVSSLFKRYILFLGADLCNEHCKPTQRLK